MRVEGGLGCAAGAVEDQRGGITAGRAHGEPLWTIADNNLIDDAGRTCVEVDDADGIHLAVLTAPDVVDDGELSVGRDLDVEWVEAGGHVVILAIDLSIADLLAVDIEQSHPIGAALGDERALAVGGDCNGDGQCRGRCRDRGRRLGGDRHRADRLHVLAVDRQHAD